ncbi:hypothetical protein [Halorubellus salinus]|uniref:hypothetical protein n=1 Tax=Halorubellus salinus TaxID=755309 RepID=UPI001D07A40A|nr:hypothetical protein [Halorubellus salinus]
MVDVGLSDATLRAVDRIGHELAIDVVGWDDDATPEAIPVKGLDEFVAARATQLTFGEDLVELGNADAEGFEKLGEGTQTWSLAEDAHLLKVTSQLGAYLKFTGAGTLSRLADGRVRLSFEHPTAVTFGYWSLVDYPEETVTVPATASGLATALSTLSSAYLSLGPDRTLPGWREYPPRLAFGDETDVPDAVADAVPDTGIELVLPDEFAYGIPAAPLAYHLAADVRVADRETPELRVPEHDVVHEFPALPEFGVAANDVFQRTFYADCLVNAARGGTDLAEVEFLDDVDLDADALFDATPAERLVAYLDAPFERIRSRLPERSHVAFVEPTAAYATALPHLVHHEARVYLPSGFDAVGASADPSVTSAWLAPGTRPGTYAASPAAYENYLAHLDAGLDDGTPEVLVVGHRRDGDREAVMAFYRHYDGLVDLSVTERRDATTAGLAAALADRRAFVHVVAERAPDGGVVCADGVLDLETVEAVGARLFALDLTGASTDADAASAVVQSLVDAGAVAGASRTGAVSRAAAQSFVRLLVNGFGLELSRRLVDRYVDGAFDVVVAGDGTHTLQADDSVNYMPLHVVANGDGTFTVTGQAGGPTAGLFWHPDVPEVRPRLLANGLAFELSATELADFLDDEGYLVVYDGELHWSNELTPFYPVA